MPSRVGSIAVGPAPAFAQEAAPASAASLMSPQMSTFSAIEAVMRPTSNKGNFVVDPILQELAFSDPARKQLMPASQTAEFMRASRPAHTSHVDVLDRRRKGSTSNATNDKELRELIARNNGRNLKEVAAEVIAAERTSRAEKTKQLFAMLWLKSVCVPAKKSVPRNRVYAHYARKCGTERVIPLNPASFGKLVRVIFPGIQTRRLGVRGESKYHYVDLALINEDDRSDSQRPRTSDSRETTYLSESFTSNQLDASALPNFEDEASPTLSPDPLFPNTAPDAPTAAASRGKFFADPFSPGLPSTKSSSSGVYEQILKFPTQAELLSIESDIIELPDIQHYCPPKTDDDAAAALSALYRTHCTSLIDCIRFCKEKQFFRLFASFHGTLTVPVQKLFAHASIAPWIRECDWLMYQKMIKTVSQLTLQVAPPVVLKFFDTISKTLHQHISRTFHIHPAHVLEAKLEPAANFATLLHRMLRVNSAAHAAAALLMVDHNRNQMWTDWVKYVNPKRIVESELPHCGYEDVYRILTSTVRGLLMPLSTPVWLENGSHYEDASVAANANPTTHQATNETVIDRLAAFLLSLPTHFPHTDTRTLIHCINAVGNAAIREITVENGLSYQSWWITKIFIDEMSLWLAAMGGFLDHEIPSEPPMAEAQNDSHPFPSAHQTLDSTTTADLNLTLDQSVMAATDDFLTHQHPIMPKMSVDGVTDTAILNSINDFELNTNLQIRFQQDTHEIQRLPQQLQLRTAASGEIVSVDSEAMISTAKMGTHSTTDHGHSGPSGDDDPMQSVFHNDDSGIDLSLMDDECSLTKY